MYLKFSLGHPHCSYSRGCRIKDAVYFQPEDNHETIAKREKVKKKLQVQHELKITFLFNFYAKLRRLKRLGRTVGRAVIPGNFKRRYKIGP